MISARESVCFRARVHEPARSSLFAEQSPHAGVWIWNATSFAQTVMVSGMVVGESPLGLLLPELRSIEQVMASETQSRVAQVRLQGDPEDQ